jgi:hypothetical protein
MNEIKIKVTKCNDCPFSEFTVSDKTAICLAPIEIHTGDYNITDYYLSGKIPDFCPLKDKALIISN